MYTAVAVVSTFYFTEWQNGKKIFMFKMTRNVKKNEIAFYDLNDTDINRNLLLHFTVLVVMHF